MSEKKTKIIKMMIEEGSDDYILIEVPDDDNIEVPEKTPPGRCVDCRWLSLWADFKRLPEKKLYKYPCASCVVMPAEILNNRYAEGKDVYSFIRKSCIAILPDGSYGFEPAGQESEQEVE